MFLLFFLVLLKETILFTIQTAPFGDPFVLGFGLCSGATPPKKNERLEPKNHPIKKENHLHQTSKTLGSFAVNFQG